jgi:hypothetical protein
VKIVGKGKEGRGLPLAGHLRLSLVGHLLISEMTMLVWKRRAQVHSLRESWLDLSGLSPPMEIRRPDRCHGKALL